MPNTVIIQEWTDEKGRIHRIEIPLTTFLTEHDLEPVVRCKDCKYRIVNEHYGKKGYLNIKAMCELDTGDPFEFSRCAENDDWYCADGERRKEKK